jgi:hypothetical protein
MQLIFPEGSPQPSLEPKNPEFYTQMQTDEKGIGIYIHCLLVWEYVTRSILEESPSAQHMLSDSSGSGRYVPVVMCLETHERFFRASRDLMFAMYENYHDVCKAVAVSESFSLFANRDFARLVSFILDDLRLAERKVEVNFGQYKIIYAPDELDQLPHSETASKRC